MPCTDVYGAIELPATCHGLLDLELTNEVSSLRPGLNLTIAVLAPLTAGTAPGRSAGVPVRLTTVAGPGGKGVALAEGELLTFCRSFGTK